MSFFVYSSNIDNPSFPSSNSLKSERIHFIFLSNLLTKTCSPVCFSLAFIFSFWAWLVPSSLLLAEDRFFKVPANGNEIEYAVTKSSITNGSSISLFIESPGIVTGGLAVDISAPTGSSVEFFQSTDSKKNPEQQKSNAWFRTSLVDYDKAAGTVQQTFLKDTTPYTRFRYFGTLQKDACNSRAKKYFYKAKVSFGGVDLNQLPENFSLNVRILFRGYSGKKAATIKPFSDGKFEPNALLLLTSLGVLNEKASLVTWRKGRPSKPKNIVIQDYVFYRGLRLTRSVVTSLLRSGRKTTFELSDGFNSYGVCFSLSRKRQSVNGYPR